MRILTQLLNFHPPSFRMDGTLLTEVAQLVEHLTENQDVASSILALGIRENKPPRWGGLLIIRNLIVIPRCRYP